jgi:ClpP class serine protease
MTRGDSEVQMKMPFDIQDVPIVLVSLLVVAIIAYTLITLYRWIVFSRKKAQAKIREQQRQSGSEATRKADQALGKLQSRAGRPIVLEVINDMTFDGTGGGAKEIVDIGTAIDILATLKSAADTQPVEIVLHTLGGWSIAAEMIANAVKNRKGSTKAFVPYIAMSAGTMIALACKEIHLGKDASLGPIDTQINGFPARSYRRLKEDKPAASMREEFLLFSYLAEKIEEDELEKACALLNEEHKKLDGADVCRVARELAGKGREHGELIGFKAAKAMGINVREGCPDEIYQLVDNRVDAIKKHYAT